MGYDQVSSDEEVEETPKQTAKIDFTQIDKMTKKEDKKDVKTKWIDNIVEKTFKKITDEVNQENKENEQSGNKVEEIFVNTQP